MNKLLILAGAALLFAAPAVAQTTTVKNEATGAKTTTEVKVRDNGTVRVEQESRTGRTKTGEAINDAAQDTKTAGKKVANGTERVGKKAVNGTKKAGKAVGKTAKKGANKVEDAVD
jgi:hypothetical protein